LRMSELSSLELKEKGNEAVRQGNWSEAITFFSQAIDIDPTNEVLYSNRALAYTALKQYAHALGDANKAVQLKPDWSRGYQRKGTVLHHVEKYAESKEAFEMGLSLDPTNLALKSGLANATRALRINEIIPKGVIAPVPIIFSVDSPHEILWETVDTLVDWYTNSGVSCLWSCSPASEYTHLKKEESIQLTSRIVERSRPRMLPVISGVVRHGDTLEEFAAHIKAMYATGVTSVVIDLCALGSKSDTEDVIFSNLSILLGLIGDIPLGIYEALLPYHRLFSATLLKLVSEQSNVWYYIDTCPSLPTLTTKVQTIPEMSPFRSYSTNGTFFTSAVGAGMHGFAGPAASFMPKIYDWLYRNSVKEADTARNLTAFLSLSEPTIMTMYPFNLKIFLKIHLNMEQIEAVSRLAQPDLSDNGVAHERILRLSHLSDAATFVREALSETKVKKKSDTSVLL